MMENKITKSEAKKFFKTDDIIPGEYEVVVKHPLFESKPIMIEVTQDTPRSPLFGTESWVTTPTTNINADDYNMWRGRMYYSTGANLSVESLQQGMRRAMENQMIYGNSQYHPVSGRVEQIRDLLNSGLITADTARSILTEGS